MVLGEKHGTNYLPYTISLLQWRFDKPPFSFSIKKQHIGLAALGGSRIERPV